MQWFCVLVMASLLAGCGKSKDPPPDILKPWRPAFERARDAQKQLDRRIGDLRREDDNAVKDDAK